MLTSGQLSRILRALPILQNADAQLEREFRAEAFLTRIPAGKDVFVESDQADAIALLILPLYAPFKISTYKG